MQGSVIVCLIQISGSFFNYPILHFYLFHVNSFPIFIILSIPPIHPGNTPAYPMNTKSHVILSKAILLTISQSAAPITHQQMIFKNKNNLILLYFPKFLSLQKSHIFFIISSSFPFYFESLAS